MRILKKCIIKKIQYLNNLTFKLSLIIKKNFPIIITLFLSGIFSSFSLPPYNYFFVNFFFFPLLFYILVNNLNKSIMFIFFIGFSYGFGYFLSNLYWISNSLKFDDNFENYVIISIFFFTFFIICLLRIIFDFPKIF